MIPVVEIEPKMFVRKPFFVKAVQVTEENMESVAEWCGGTVCTVEAVESDKCKYVKVEVSRPMYERQTKGYVGDWVLSSESGNPNFKVYTRKAFESSFDVFDSIMRDGDI